MKLNATSSFFSSFLSPACPMHLPALSQIHDYSFLKNTYTHTLYYMHAYVHTHIYVYIYINHIHI